MLGGWSHLIVGRFFARVGGQIVRVVGGEDHALICNDRGGERGDALPRGRLLAPYAEESEHGDRNNRTSSVMGSHIGSVKTAVRSYSFAPNRRLVRAV